MKESQNSATSTDRPKHIISWDYKALDSEQTGTTRMRLSYGGVREMEKEIAMVRARKPLST